MNEYWDERERELLYNSTLGEAEKELSRQYLRCFRKTQQQMINLYNELINADGEILISDLYKFNRYYDLLNNLSSNLQRLGIEEEKLYREIFENFYRQNSTIIGESVNWFLPIDEESVKKAIDAIWCADGKHWSDRIWSNKALLEERIKDGIVDCIARGASKDELVKQLMRDFDIGFNQADRIARTELAYIQNKSTLDTYELAGIEKYEVLANQAEDASCGNLHGQQFYLHEAQVGVNFPPFHPNCKCAILAVL